MSFNKQSINRGLEILSWGLYDLANQFFALNVVSLYFVRWLTIEKKAPEILYSASFGISLFCVALLAPILGTVSDLARRRRIFLVFFTLLSIFFTSALGFSPHVWLSIMFFAVANFGCQMAVVFYNSQLSSVAPPKKSGIVSGFGRMLGYSGAILALLLIKPIIMQSGYRAAFLPTGLLFLVFSLPCMIFIKDPHPAQEQKLLQFFAKERVREVFLTLKSTAFGLKKIAGLNDFLKSIFFGLAAVNIIILFMSVYATRVFGLDEENIIKLIAFSTLFAIAGSFLSGFIGDFLGYKRTLCAVFLLWAVSFLMGALAREQVVFWVIGGMVGFAMGASWSVSRALCVTIAPEERMGEVFGLFNFMGYMSAVFGAVYWGVITLLLRSLSVTGERIALLSLVIFMVLAFLFLRRLPYK